MAKKTAVSAFKEQGSLISTQNNAIIGLFTQAAIGYAPLDIVKNEHIRQCLGTSNKLVLTLKGDMSTVIRNGLGPDEAVARVNNLLDFLKDQKGVEITPPEGESKKKPKKPERELEGTKISIDFDEADADVITTELYQIVAERHTAELQAKDTKLVKDALEELQEQRQKLHVEHRKAMDRDSERAMTILENESPAVVTEANRQFNAAATNLPQIGEVKGQTKGK